MTFVIWDSGERFETDADKWLPSYGEAASAGLHGEVGVLRISQDMYNRLSSEAKASLVKV